MKNTASSGFAKFILLVTVLFTGAVVTMLSGCASSGYIEKNYSKNIEKLQTCGTYDDAPVEFEMKYLVDEERAEEIRAYFKENTSLDLYAVAASEKSTWEKAVELAVFVAKNIPHDNQKKMLKNRNAITLWEYSRSVPTGFNCRWHATLLSELMLAAGIKNRFITCLPEDKFDGDCHVVNIVWLPELKKWAMIDSDMIEYVTDDDGIPLSLEEMRETVISGRQLNISVLPGFEKYWVAKPSGMQYMQAYWAKNLYWFSAHSTYGFDLEGERKLPDAYTALIPQGFDCSHSYNNGYATSNPAAFWDDTKIY